MKKLLIVLTFLISFLAFPRLIYAQETGWEIDNFHSEINVLENGKVSVSETIYVNFNNIQKHGIYRDLIYKKESTDQKKHYLSYEISQVKLDDSTEQYETSYDSDFFRIKIGDPGRTITGPHVYKIDYQATGAVGSFPDHDELYWNITGNYWTIPILKADATVSLPQDGINQITCYLGEVGSTTLCESSKDSQATASFKSVDTLDTGQGLTVVVGFTKGMVAIIDGKAPPAFGIELIDLLVFCLTFFPISLIAFYLWYKKGRDHWFKRRFMDDPNTRDEVKPIGGHDTIVVEFDPPEKLKPAEMITLLNEEVSTVAITATIVDLAVRGYLKITETEKGLILKSKDYELVKQNKDWLDLSPYENELIARLFEKGDSVKISSLKNSFYKDIKVFKDSLNQAMKDKGFFFDNPSKIKSKYIGTGVVLIVVPISIVLILKIILPYLTAVLVGLALGGVFVSAVGYFMSARTAKGHELKNRVLGYKLFISTAEKYRQQFFERRNMFNEILPYAIVFGQTEKFAKAFASLGVQPPETNWYVGAAAFNAVTFSNDMSSFASSFSSTMSSNSGFSGGSSGGGGGGGGGW